MKRCTFCGREGSRMTPIHNRWTGVVDWWKCSSPVACIRRQEQLGEWVGKRVLYRQDADGTRWTIRRLSHRDGVSGGPWWVLTCEYRQHRSTSWHSTATLAKAHRDDLVRSWEARSLTDYAEPRR